MATSLPIGQKPLFFPNPPETPISPDLPETSFKSGQSDPTLPPDPSTSDLTSTDHTEKKLKWPRSDTPPPRRALGMYYQQQQLNDNFRQWGPQGSSTHSYHGQWMGRDDDDGQSMSSSYSHHYSDPGVAVSTYMCTCTCIYVYLLWECIIYMYMYKTICLNVGSARHGAAYEHTTVSSEHAFTAHHQWDGIHKRLYTKAST